MRILIITLLGIITAMPFARAEERCTAPDKDFNTFIDRFKNDKQFQESRILYPLEMSSTEPDAKGDMTTTYLHLSHKQIKDRSILIIRGRTEAEVLGDGEGKLCEQGPAVDGNTATLLQYSCHTDVYGYEYTFILNKGCWYLQSLATSGG